MRAHSALKKKRKAYRFGLWAELAAVLYYLCRGYWPIARRYKTKRGEIDLIVKNARRLIFVEVKARKGSAGVFPLSEKQLLRITHAAMLFVAKYPRFAKLEQKIELVQVRPWALPYCISQ